MTNVKKIVTVSDIVLSMPHTLTLIIDHVGQKSAILLAISGITLLMKADVITGRIAVKRQTAGIKCTQYSQAENQHFHPAGATCKKWKFWIFLGPRSHPVNRLT